MKMIKLALLGGAALAVTTAAAKADDLANLKAQIESLNARVATMEAAPAVPAGYSLMTMGDAQTIVAPGAAQKGDKDIPATASTISVLPTADAPAAANLQWTGLVRAIVGYHKVDGDDADYDVSTRGQINVVAKTDTAVGEVGVEIRLRANSDLLGANPTVKSPKYWGWWSMTPELSLAGGYAGSLGNVGYGYDGACTCYGTDNADVAFNPSDAHQLALLYASGPFSAGLALEDASTDVTSKDFGTKAAPALRDIYGKPFGGGDASLGVAGNIKYSGDTLNAGLYGVWRDGDTADADAYQVGVGMGASFDPVSLSFGAAMGQINNGQDFWGVSALASVSLSDQIHAELGVGYKDYSNYGKNFGASVKNGVTPADDQLGVLAGVYYTPVDQLTLGIEGEYVDHRSSNNKIKNAKGAIVNADDAKDELFLDFVSVWSF